MAALDCRQADRLPPHTRQPDGRNNPRPQRRRIRQYVRHPNRVARPRRHLPPVGHAANLHLDLWAPNFGIQEWCRFSEAVYEVFPGTPEVRGGYMYPNDKPGLGIDVNEELAAKYPCTDEVIGWTQTRLPDSSPTRP